MKKTVLLALSSIALSLATTAQDINKQIGIRFNNGGYDILIKKQQPQADTFSRFRIGSNVGNFNVTFNQNKFQYAANFNLAVGKEKHHQAYKDLYFILGHEYLFNISSTGYSDKQQSKVLNFVDAGFGYGVVLGFGYEVVPQLNIALEMIPNIMGNVRTYYNNNTTSFDTRINTGSIVFTALYTFKKQPK